jgi:hypothetical protein
MTKLEMIQALGEYEFSTRAQKELDNMADDDNADRFIRKHHIIVEVNPDMVAWQEVQKAQATLKAIHKGEHIDLMLASAGLVADEESEVEQKLRKIIADNWEAAQRWERWTGSKR